MKKAGAKKTTTTGRKTRATKGAPKTARARTKTGTRRATTTANTTA